MLVFIFKDGLFYYKWGVGGLEFKIWNIIFCLLILELEEVN